MQCNMMDYILEQAQSLLAIKSPTGYTKEAADYLFTTLTEMGYQPKRTAKNSIVVCLGGEGNPILLTAHVDTLGAIVREVKANGRLSLSPIGGLVPNNVDSENCTVITRFSGSYCGTFQMNDPSSHVNLKLKEQPRDFDTMEVVLDEKVYSKEETEALGVSAGDFVAFDPRTVLTESGYLKSRFIDDKGCSAILLAYAKHLKDTGTLPGRKVYLHFTVYEETGHGAAAGVPDDVQEILSLDMGCVGIGLGANECNVSICAKDSRGPYDYDMTTALIKTAKDNGLDYAVDIYPGYGSDADAALSAGHDLLHALIGPGVYASHGYERTHEDGLANTYLLLKAYLG